MKISVCIPTFKRPSLLMRALDSVLAQDVQAYEILIGDDSPDDSTEAFVNELVKRFPNDFIHYEHHRPALGQSANVAKLFELATGDLITLLHDDDRFRPGAFKAMLLPMQENPEIVGCYGRQVVINSSGFEDMEATWRLMEHYGKGKNVSSGLVNDAFLAGALQHFPNNSFLVRSSAAKAVDYCANNRAKNACDWYFGLRLGQLGRPFYFVDEFLADYFLTPDSLGRARSNSSFYKTAIFLEDFDPDLFPPVLQQRLREIIKAGIFQSAEIDAILGWKWYFSRWHRASLLTLGGARRFWNLVCSTVFQ